MEDHTRGWLMSAVRQNRQTCVNFKRSYRPSLVRGGATSRKILRRVSTGILWTGLSALVGWDQCECQIAA